MTTANGILESAEAEVCRPWLRHILSHAGWTEIAHASATENWTLLAHWADNAQAHALFLDPAALKIVPVSTPIEAGHYPALSPLLPAAAWYERMVQDLWGHTAQGCGDARPWLDHGKWPHARPMATRPGPRAPGEPPQPREYDQEGAMVLPLGPIWGRLEEAAHLRLTLHGSAIKHAEALLGFTHKGTLALIRGKSPRNAARFAARLSADATVAHSVAFAQAAEHAMNVEAPPRARALRVAMMEIERIAGHLDNLAEVARLADAPRVRSRCGALREDLLRASDAAFGHRLMMDCVIPGGVASDIAGAGSELIPGALATVASALGSIRRQHDGSALSARLLGIGRVTTELAASFAVGGVAGRASGGAFDARTVFSPEYRALTPRTDTRTEGDAAARQLLRISEIEDSIRLVGCTLAALPDGPVSVTLPQLSGEGVACAESIRGDVWHWLQIDRGQISGVFARDPGWALWPLAEHVLESATADDADLIRASFALPASGMDL